MTETPDAVPAAYVALDAALEAGWERAEPSWAWAHLRDEHGTEAWVRVDGSVMVGDDRAPGFLEPRVYFEPRTPDDWRVISEAWRTR